MLHCIISFTTALEHFTVKQPFENINLLPYVVVDIRRDFLLGSSTKVEAISTKLSEAMHIFYSQQYYSDSNVSAHAVICGTMTLKKNFEKLSFSKHHNKVCLLFTRSLHTFQLLKIIYTAA